jgi:hypothetical protein
MIFITLPGMVVLLLPIIVSETTFVVHRTKLRKQKVLWATTVANIVSTLVGVPLTWGALVFCEFGLSATLARFTQLSSRSWDSPIYQVIGTMLSAPWLAPVGKSASWAVPLAALVLLIPFFFISVWIEQAVMEHLLPVTTASSALSNEVNDKILRSAVRGANLMSYGFLFSFVSVSLVLGIYHP